MQPKSHCNIGNSLGLAFSFFSLYSLIKSSHYEISSLLPSLNVRYAHLCFLYCVFPLSYLAFVDTHVPVQVLSGVHKACVSEDAGIVIEIWITAFPGLKFAVYIAFLIFASLSRAHYFYNRLINKD